MFHTRGFGQRPTGLARAVTRGAVAVAVIGAMLNVAAPASADAFGGCNSNEGCVPDNFNHWYCFSGAVNTNLQTAFVASMANLEDQTNYVAFAETAGCNNVTDLVVVQDSSLGARGNYRCETRNPQRLCERATLTFNPNNLPSANDRRKTTCHEIGHSVGLRHGVPDVDNDADPYLDCMHSGAVAAGADALRYNTHHVTHINNQR